MEFRKAERKKARARCAICGPAGAGKTHGALLLAAGLGENILLIDTESGSGDLEVGKPGIPEYYVETMEPPFDPAKYIEIIKAAEKQMDVIIIDSLSHAWAGSGGLLDQQGKISDRGTNSFAAWRQITPKHNSLVDCMLQSSAHIIATMRSKQEYVLEEDSRGKKAPRKVGLAPVQRDGLEYEFTIVFDVDQKTHTAMATKDRSSLFPPDQMFKISRDTGDAIHKWLDSGVESVTTPAPQEAAAEAEAASEPQKEAPKAQTQEKKSSTKQRTKAPKKINVPEPKDESADREMNKNEKNKLLMISKEAGYEDLAEAIALLEGEIGEVKTLAQGRALAMKIKASPKK